MSKQYVGQSLHYGNQQTISPLEHAIKRTDGRNETISSIYAGTRGSASISGQLALVPILLPSGKTYTQMGVCTGTIAGSTLTHWWHALFNNSYQMLAVTTDDTTASISTNTAKILNIATVSTGASSSFTTTYEGLYYFGVMIASSAGANIPSLTGSGAVPPPVANADPAWGFTDSGLTTPPAFPYTAPTPSGTGLAYYGWVV